MKTARFWTRAQGDFPGEDPNHRLEIKARGWSNESLGAARAKALEVAARVAERIAAGISKEPQRYPYGDRPLPEPIIREFTGAVVTRNAYGALVLNTDRMMFVDIDRKAAPPKSPGLFSSLFGKPKPAPAEDPVTAELAAITTRHKLGARLYETAAGYRIIITSAPFTPGSQEAEALLTEYKSDPLYTRLCRLQESFRARLTPKPWRCNFPKHYPEFPFETPSEQTHAQAWETEYTSKSAPYATCRFIAEYGPSPNPAFKPLIDFHDTQTKATVTQPLA